MSAYSQLLGLYPLGTGQVFNDSSIRKASIPPFEISSKAKNFINKAEVLHLKYSPIPIHVIDPMSHLLTGYSPLICPYADQLITESFEKQHQRTKDILSPCIMKWKLFGGSRLRI